MTISHERIRPQIGVTVRGLDAAKAPGPADAKEILALLETHGVIVFPGLAPDDRQQIALAEALGKIEPAYRGDPAHAPEHPELQTISVDPELNKSAAYLKGALFWHIDGATTGVPPLASILAARVLPEGGAGTEFCNTYAAYEALPEPQKAAFEKLSVVHSLEASQRLFVSDPTEEQLKAWRRLPPRELPLVWTHGSGRKSLVLGATASQVVGMEPADSQALLDRVLAWATRPEFVYRHDWQEGDVVMWDNRGTMHRACPYDPDAPRVLRRVELAGEEPIA